MITVYGIPNCDTIKRARKRLDEAGIAYRFHDFRRDGIDPGTVRRFLDKLGADALINRRGTSWRGLSATEQAACTGDYAIAVLCRQPALIKRPVFERGGELKVGFARKDEAALLDWLNS